NVALLQLRRGSDRLPEIGADLIRELLELCLVLRLGQRRAGRLPTPPAASAPGDQQAQRCEEDEGSTHARDPTSRSSPELLVEADRLDPERLSRRRDISDVVARLE